MSDRYKGAILSGTAPTVTLQSAGGEYTLSQQMQYQGQGVWPTAAQNPILNSLRFRSSALAYLNRTPATATNRKTWTWSGWAKRGILNVDSRLFGAGTSNSDRALIQFETYIGVVATNSGSNVLVLNTTPFYADPAAWYHVVVAVDTTQATSSNRAKVYVNGVQVTDFTAATYPAQNTDLYINSTAPHVIGTRGTYSVDSNYDGLLAEVNFIDGVALTPSSFGTTDVNGIWQPIPYSGSYGTNGFYLPFSDIALTSGSNAGLGKDFSGNGNYWNTNNISVTSGSTYDAMLDSPSNASSTIGNYCVLSPIDTYDNPPTQGNLTRIGVGHTGSPWSTCRATVGASSGKWYFEATLTGSTGSTGNNMVGVMTTTTSTLSDAYGGSTTRSYQANGGLQGDGSTGTVASAVSGDVIMIAYDIDASKMWVGKNGTWQNSGNPVTGAGPVFTYLPTSPIVPQVSMYGNTGDNYGWYTNFGQQPFVYTPPTGFNRLNTYNLPVPTIPAGNKVMDAALYTGDGTSPKQVVSSLNFQPDFSWTKTRSASTQHALYDSVRGAGSGKILLSDTTDAEGGSGGTSDATYGYLSAFNSNGITTTKGSNATNYFFNNSGVTYVSWNWQAGQGVTSSNTNGSITSTVSVNQAAGFSIVTYTANNTAGATVGHGLGVVPSMIITKCRNNANSWNSYHISVGNTKGIDLNSTDAANTSSNYWNNTTPTSSVFTTGVFTNNSTFNYVAYCWAPVAGFSAFGSYTGNGSADGPFVYTGFRPKFVLIKNTTTAGTSWVMVDTSRSPYNVANLLLLADSSGSEVTTNTFDILSNGIKLRSTDGSRNANGDNYIYMAFAENPFKMARAR